MTIKHTYKEVERQRRESDILAAAEQMLVEGGYANLNMDELAGLVGISKPTLYQHFKGKEELAVRVLLRSYSSINEFLSRPLDEPAIDRLFGLLRRCVAIQAPGSLTANLRPDLRPEMVMTAMRDFGGFEDRKQQFFRQIRDLVDKAKSEGSIDPAIPTPIVTHMLLALGQSFAHPSIQIEVGTSPAQIEAGINTVLRVFLHGVAPLATSTIQQPS
jgi:TetR/AcrR family transcriptional regulator, cholesterol catabolism regulator